MTNVMQDAKNIWDRLFNHKPFLTGEIKFMVNEFEEKRNDAEVDQLFSVVENVTEVKDSQIERLSQSIKNLTEAEEKLTESLLISRQLISYEQKYKEDTTVAEAKRNRKDDWESFMDHITTEYAEINSTHNHVKNELEMQYHPEKNKQQTSQA